MDGTHVTERSGRTHVTSSTGGDAGRSYRRASRTYAHRPIAIYPRQRGGRTGRQVARLKDYSASGIGLVAGQPVETGSRFAVRLVNPDGSKVALVFEVVYCQPAENGTFQVGARLPERHVAPQAPREYETSIMGKTVSNWDRVLDIRAEPDRLWLNMHPPHSESGWGMYVDRGQLEAALLGEATTEKKAA